MSAQDQLVEDMDAEKSRSTANPDESRPLRAGGRGTPGAELAQDPRKPPLVTPEKDLSGVPTKLEEILQLEGEGKNGNEVLGVLIAAHEREAMSILERTRLAREDVVTIGKAFFIAKHGIGGDVPDLNQPIPEVAELVINILRALPSVDGGSRREFVEAWDKSREERRYQMQEEMRRKERYTGA